MNSEGIVCWGTVFVFELLQPEIDNTLKVCARINAAVGVRASFVNDKMYGSRFARDRLIHFTAPSRGRDAGLGGRRPPPN